MQIGYLESRVSGYEQKERIPEKMAPQLLESQLYVYPAYLHTYKSVEDTSDRFP